MSMFDYPIDTVNNALPSFSSFSKTTWVHF